MRFNQLTCLISTLILGVSAFAQNEDQRYVSSYYEFEEGSKELLYGDNVVFRSEPSTSSEAIDTLEIGTEITIVRMSEEKTKLNGLDWNWYQVKVGRKKGYILGGLIALDHIKFDDALYLVTMAGIDKSMDDYEYTDYKVRTRVLTPTGDYYGHESNLNTNLFYIQAQGNRGIEGIGHMLVIDLVAEACGVDGGQIYLFNDGARLIEAIQLSSVSDAGAFWFSETLTFPEDKGGWDGIVQYKRELGIPQDEEYNWTKATIHTINLRWENGQFAPNIADINFEEDE
jgi:hypothetical protein